MVFGFGDGKIDLILPKTSFTEGEKISGKIKLDLNKPVHSKGLSVKIWAERTVPKRVVDANGNAKIENQNQILYNFSSPVSGEEDYNSRQVDFQISVPKLAEAIPQGGVLGAIQQVSNIMGLAPGPIRWYLSAALERHLAFDLAKIIQIQVV